MASMDSQQSELVAGNEERQVVEAGESAITSLRNKVQDLTQVILKIDLSKPIDAANELPQTLNQLLNVIFGDPRLPEACSELEQILTSAENTELHIAVTGESGAGKSSFINCLLGLKPEDDGAAPIGVKQTTTEVKHYSHPQFPNVKFSDLPGIGTPDFQAAKYLQKVNFPQYDFFIIISSVRFRENDRLLAQEIRKKKKLFYFVRSKVDEDLKNEKRAHPRTYNEENVLKSIREDCKINLTDFNNHVFLVSTWDLDKLDFPDLVEILGNDLPSLKKRAFLLSLPNKCPEIIKKKKDIVKGELWKIALVSACINAVPIPCLPVAVNAVRLRDYMAEIYKFFWLDNHSLAQLASFLNQPVEILKDEIKSCPEERIQLNNIGKIIGNIDQIWFKKLYKASSSLGQWVGQSSVFGKLRAAIPSPLDLGIPALPTLPVNTQLLRSPAVSAPLLNAGLSFVVTYWMLSRFVNDVVEDAERVRVKAAESIHIS